MADKHVYTIEPIGIEPININVKDVEGIKRAILKHANGLKKGESEIDVSKGFASKLEHTFGAKISLFNCPSEELNYWTLILPKDGNFDATPSKISVSFHIKRVENPELI